METPYRLLAEGESPSLRIGPCAECSADFHRHGAMGVVGGLCALALGGGRRVGNRVEMSCAFVLCTPRVIQAPRESPRVTLVGVGHHVGAKKVAERGAEVLGRPGTDAQGVRPMRGGRGIDDDAIDTSHGLMPCCQDDERIGETQPRVPWWLAQT